MIPSLLTILILTLATYTTYRLARTLTNRARNALDVRHPPKIDEWQARKNAAPLTNAIIHVADHTDRGEN